MRVLNIKSFLVSFLVCCVFLTSPVLAIRSSDDGKQGKNLKRTEVKQRKKKDKRKQAALAESFLEWKKFKKAQKGKKWRAEFDYAKGTLRSLAGDLTKPLPGTPAEAAREFLRRNSKLLRLREEQLGTEQVTARGKWVHVSYDQEYQGLPVERGRVTVHLTANNEVAVLHSSIAPDLNISVIPTIDEHRALAVVKADLVTSPHPARPPQVELVIFPNPADGKTYLAWKVRVSVYFPPASWSYYLDAHTGAVIYKVDTIRHATAGKVQGKIFPAHGDDPLWAEPFFGQEIWVAAAGAVTVFSDDMEGGINGWTKADYSANGELWHQINSHLSVSPFAHSGSFSWWCGVDVTGQYDDLLDNALISPLINLGPYSGAELIFWHHFETEEGWDFMYVEITPDGGFNWYPLKTISGAGYQWRRERLDISAYAGNNVNIRFRLDSDTYLHGYFSWFIDDVVVTGTSAASESAVTDDNGDYSIPVNGELYSQLAGPYAQVINEDQDEVYHQDPPSGQSWSWDYLPSDPRVDEVNVFYHVNRAHRFVKNQLGYSGMDYQMTAVVRYGTAYNNAFYDEYRTIVLGDGDAGVTFLDFAQAADVIYHEYGHALQQSIYGKMYYWQPGAIDEAYADYFAVTLTDDPMIGEWVQVSGPMRDLSVNKVFPDDWQDEVHGDGEIYGSAMWDVRQALGTELADQVLFEALFFQPWNFWQGLKATLMADDDDGNLGNGTPHGIEIETAFAAHGISLSVSVPPDTVYEPNNDFDEAYGPLSSGTAYDSYISTAQDTDYYYLTAGSGDLVIDLTVPAGQNYVLYVFLAGYPEYIYWLADSGGVGGDESVTITADNELYHILVVPYDPWFDYSTVSNYTLTATFTAAPADGTPPGIPSVPTTGGIYTGASAVFSWTRGDAYDFESGISGYNLQVGTAPNGNDIFDAFVGNVLCYELGGLTHGMTYYARVSARNGATPPQDSAFSASSDGVTADLTPPLGACAPIGQGWLDATTLELSWEEGNFSDAESGIAGYYLQVKESGPDTIVFENFVGKVPSETVYGLDNNKSYYIRFKALNGAGQWTQFFESPGTYISGRVINALGEGVAGVELNLAGHAASTATTDAQGYYGFFCLEAGDYTLTLAAAGWDFLPADLSVLLSSAGSSDQDFLAVAEIAGDRVMVQGGREGYVNPLAGEKALIVITPPDSGTVSIGIYTLRGELIWEEKVSVSADVRTLVSWNGRNPMKIIVASGIYLVRVTGAGMNEVKKVAVIK